MTPPVLPDEVGRERPAGAPPPPLAELRTRLAEVENALRAIRPGAVDAITAPALLNGLADAIAHCTTDLRRAEALTARLAGNLSENLPESLSENLPESLSEAGA